MAAVNRRIAIPRKMSTAAHSITELKRIHRAARKTLKTAHGRITTGVAAGMDAADPTVFLTPREASAVVLLLAAERGWNRSVIETMTVPTARADAQDGREGAIFITDLNKPRSGRSGRHRTASLGDGAGGDVLAAIIEATEPARRRLSEIGTPTERLIVYCNYWGTSVHVGLPVHEVGIAWAEDEQLKDDGGAPLVPSARRLRKTLQVLDRQPRQNSRAVHNRTYVATDETVRQDVAIAILGGQEHALQTAEATMAARVLDARLVKLVATDPDTASRETGLSKNTLIDVVGGRRETAAVACSDMHSSPWQAPGTLCRCSFLLCLTCGNAVATPQHLPKLVYLRQSLEALSSSIPEDVWRQHWAAHYARVHDVLASIGSAEEQANATVTDGDRALIDELLTGRLDA